jgi:ABC-type Zn uptake system ZnuABC Zn-binding protein ZnuA
MKKRNAYFIWYLISIFSAGLVSVAGSVQGEKPLSVAVAESDIEAIVRAVGGDQVDTYDLFKGCILRKNLDVESGAAGRLVLADAVVWTGFLKESAAINAHLGEKPGGSSAGSRAPVWIDVSKGVTRVNIQTSTCYGYIDAEMVSGDPHFWLNPENGPAIARNIAKGLSELRPGKRRYFQANAEAFTKALNSDIDRWKRQLSRLAGLRIFATQCGWQNFSKLGGPRFVVCKATPGSLPDYNNLMDQLRRMEVDVVIVDPNTSPEYEQAFREEPGLTVLKIPSSIDTIPGAKTYPALFENLVRTLLEKSPGPRNS